MELSDSPILSSLAVSTNPIDAVSTVEQSSSKFDDYLKKSLTISTIPEFIWKSLSAKNNRFWLKCQNGQIKIGFLRWFTNEFTCPDGSNCEIFCRTCVDKYGSLAISNQHSDENHVFSSHWNEIQQFPIFISRKFYKQFYNSSKTTTTNPQKLVQLTVILVEYKSPLRRFTEETVCAKIFPNKKERDEMKKDPIAKEKSLLVKTERAKAKIERATLKKAEYEKSKEKSENSNLVGFKTGI